MMTACPRCSQRFLMHRDTLWYQQEASDKYQLNGLWKDRITIPKLWMVCRTRGSSSLGDKTSYFCLPFFSIHFPANRAMKFWWPQGNQAKYFRVPSSLPPEKWAFHSPVHVGLKHFAIHTPNQSRFFASNMTWHGLIRSLEIPSWKLCPPHWFNRKNWMLYFNIMGIYCHSIFVGIVFWKCSNSDFAFRASFPVSLVQGSHDKMSTAFRRWFPASRSRASLALSPGDIVFPPPPPFPPFICNLQFSVSSPPSDSLLSAIKAEYK